MKLLANLPIYNFDIVFPLDRKVLRKKIRKQNYLLVFVMAL